MEASVGASLLAMVVNDNVASLTPLVTLGIIASRLAPTEAVDSMKIVQPRVVRRR
jgi:hypothetical protein